MLRSIILLAVLGFGLLAAATVILAWLNWSPRLYTPVITALVIGTITGFVSIATTLKPARFARSFATVAVIYRDEVAAPVAIPKTVAASQRIDLAMLLNQLPPEQRRAASVDSVINAGVEAAQYALVKLMREIQSGGWASSNIGGVTTPIVRSSSPATTLKPIDAAVLKAALARNRFFALPSETFYWQNVNFSVPPGTRIELYHVPSSPATGVERRGIRLLKPLFFHVDIAIESLGVDSGLPGDVDISVAERARAGTLLLRISGTVNFERLTAGNQKTDEYKLWSEWLLSELAARLAVGG